MKTLLITGALSGICNTSDIANMAECLLSEKSGWITVQVIHVDG